jgi:hypothetical protein
VRATRLVLGLGYLARSWPQTARTVLLLPGAGHRPAGSAVTENLLRHQLRFLQRHLEAGVVVD